MGYAIIILQLDISRLLMIKAVYFMKLSWMVSRIFWVLVAVFEPIMKIVTKFLQDIHIVCHVSIFELLT